ncbi:MAG: amidohydrolase family protein, partial [bacterium]
KKMPSTRMGTAALMREYFVKTLNYIEKKKKRAESFERNLIFEALEKILKKEVPLRCHAHRFDDIATIIRIKDEFDFNLVIEHATDGHKIAEYISEKKVPCVVGPTLTSKVKEELKDRDFKTLKILSKAGVLCAITTDSPVIPVQYLPLMAAYSVKAGLPRYEALRAITVNPASICGVVSRVGTLEPGKDADIAIFDGDPFLVETRCVMTIVDGKIVWNNL